VKMTPN